MCLPLGVSLAQSPGTRTRLESQAEGERQWILVPFPLQDLSFRKFPRSHQFREMSPSSLPKERQGGWALSELLLCCENSLSSSFCHVFICSRFPKD